MQLSKEEKIKTINRGGQLLHILDVDHLTIRVKAQTFPRHRRPDWVRAIEDLIELLQRAVFCLWDEEVDGCRLDAAPDCEDDVRVPADLVHCDGPGELVEEAG